MESYHNQSLQVLNEEFWEANYSKVYPSAVFLNQLGVELVNNCYRRSQISKLIHYDTIEFSRNPDPYRSHKAFWKDMKEIIEKTEEIRDVCDM